MAAFKSINVSEYISTFDLSTVDLSGFTDPEPTVFAGLTRGDTIEVAGPYEDFLKALPQRFDGYTDPGVDSPMIRRGAVVRLHEIAGLSGDGVITGRYRQRDGRVHFWGTINP